MTVRRKHRSLGKPDETALRNHYRHTPCQGCFTVARPNMLACHMHRGQCGGTRRIQCDARSAQIEAIGNTVGRNAMRCAGRRVRTDAGGVPGAALDDLVVIMRNSNEQREVRPLLKIQHNARILHRLPGRLQQEPVLWIHVGRFTRRDPEELRIELIDPIHKSTAPGDGFASQARFGIVKPLYIPAIRRHLAYRLTALNEEFPK